MKDFIKIGGAITSSPLNENFRRLRNDISISNTNLIFPEEHGIEMTVGDMEALKTNPDVTLLNGQVCYTVSSGELYRYNSNDNTWYKIADFGQTFRQAFLTSGVVMIQNQSDETKSYITKVDNHTLNIPALLVYFKTLPGDERYLKGMYRIENMNIDTSAYTTANSYSIYLNGSEVVLQQPNNINDYVITEGLPKEDVPNMIYVGSFLVNEDGNIIDNFIYTLPDIAFTEDRGLFYLTGGQTKGCNLIAAGEEQNLLGGMEGFYYDEGINTPQGNLDDFPVDGLDVVNYNIRQIKSEDGLSRSIYLYPVNPIGNPMVDTAGAVDYNHYYNNGSLDEVGEGQFTIQRHLITPYGYDCTDLIVYGSKLYNSMEDAMSEINQLEAMELNIPYVEVSRLVVGVPTEGESFHTDDPTYCRFITLDRLSQVGTLEPKFADTAFVVYSGRTSDITPAKIRFNLDNLEDENFNETMELWSPTRARIKYLYGDPQLETQDKYIAGETVETVNTTENVYRDLDVQGNTHGFVLADNDDIVDIRGRLKLIEAEIWDTLRQINSVDSPIYQQSIRYRLYHLESRVTSLETRMDTAESNIVRLDNIKVDKRTTINGYQLGTQLTNPNETNNIVLVTDDINETTNPTNLWFTQERVSDNSDVKEALAHARSMGRDVQTGKNPHDLDMDDIDDGTNYHAVNTAQLGKINNLPNNTVAELATKISGIDILKNNTKQHDDEYKITQINFNPNGVNISWDDDAPNKVNIECIGQMPNDVMRKTIYDPTNQGYVDRAAAANTIYGIEDVEPNTYYGTDEEQIIGFHTLPKYVSSEARDITSLDNFLFTPENKSVWLSHLGDSKVNYPVGTKEHELGTNVYDLVVNHFHKVYDSGIQPVISNYKGVLKDNSTHVIFSIGNNNYYFDDTNVAEDEIVYFTIGDDNVTIENDLETRSASVTQVDFIHTKYSATQLIANTTYYLNDDGVYYSFFPSVEEIGGPSLFYNNYTKTLYAIKNNTTVSIPLTRVSEPSGIEIIWTNSQILSMNTQPDWNSINEWSFGDGLNVSVSGNKATITATDPSSSTVKTFAGLDDVNVIYSLDNIGKFLTLQNEGTEINPIFRIKLENGLNPADYMLKNTYVDNLQPNKVKNAVNADNALLAEHATSADESINAQTLQHKNIDDTGTTTASLWTSAKIINYVDTTTPDTYCGTVVPSSGNYKEGDIFVLIN